MLPRRSISFTRGLSSIATMSTKSSKLSKFLIGSSVALGTLYGVDTFYWDTTCQRTVRAFYVLSRIGLDYKFNFEEGKDIMALHERNAERLFNLLIKNKGLYVKLGQNIANQSSILPKVFQEKFNKLYDSAATDPWDEVERIMKEELGDEYTKNFKNFNKEPIASASIAQVHKAELVNGEKVAVKVQHYYINNQIDMDLWTFKVITEVFSRAFGVPFGFMAHYIADTMKEEVDFTIELANSKRTRKNIQDDSYLRDKVYVPQTFDNFCSRRVLVAEWCDGEPLFKVDELKKSFDVTDILHDYVKLFSKMIFQWGFVHSDPHPGNLLARYNNGKQQLVLLDHGLYVELPESLRHEYCTLWKSLFELNDKELKRIAVSWGIGSDQSDMFGSFALLKPYHKSQEKFAQMSRYEREKFMSDNFKQFFQNTEKFPLPLIFLGRTMRMVQSVNQRYRAPVNRINIFTREAVNGFYLSAPATHLTAWNKVERALRYSIYMITMSLVDISFYFTKLSQYLFGTKNVEDLLQEKMIAEMKEMGIENPEIDMFSG